jgi:hypothetical protein
LESYVPTSAEYSYLKRLAERIPVPAATKSATALQEARATFAEGDIDNAFRLAAKLPVSFTRTALLLRCAREMGTLAAAEVALESIDSLSDRDRAELENHTFLVRIRDSLRDLSADQTAKRQIPGNWNEWLKKLSSEQPWTSALAVAETGSREWSFDEALGDPSELERIADLLLAERPEWGQEALRDALPYIVEFFLSGSPTPRLKPIYENLFLTVALDPQISLTQVAALVRIGEARLQLGVSDVEYGEVLEHLGNAILAVESPSVVGMALDALEVAINAPAVSPPNRQQFALRLFTVFRRWHTRIDATQFALLRSLAKDLDVVSAIPSTDEVVTLRGAESIWRSLDGRRVAMYSLQESALRRAAAVVAELCPSVRVDGFHDHVGGSPALRNAANTADIFVIATGAAKHAATTFIESRRPKDSITLYARGQGSSSLVEALRGYLEET